MSRSTKKNEGGELLFKKSEWCAAEDVKGTDLEMTKNPILEEAFSRVLDKFEQTNKNVLFGLCSTTRPYSLTPTWKAFSRVCEGKADPIITSGGGIVPLKFESEWPFLTYDVPVPGDNEAYIACLKSRLVAFLSAYQYERVVFVYLPSKRNRLVAKIACEEISVDYSIVPSPTTWMRMTERVTSRNNPAKRTTRYAADGYLWRPLAHPLCLDEVRWRLGGCEL